MFGFSPRRLDLSSALAGVLVLLALSVVTLPSFSLPASSAEPVPFSGTQAAGAADSANASLGDGQAQIDPYQVQSAPYQGWVCDAQGRCFEPAVYQGDLSQWWAYQAAVLDGGTGELPCSTPITSTLSVCEFIGEGSPGSIVTDYHFSVEYPPFTPLADLTVNPLMPRLHTRPMPVKFNFTITMRRQGGQPFEYSRDFDTWAVFMEEYEGGGIFRRDELPCAKATLYVQAGTTSASVSVAGTCTFDNYEYYWLDALYGSSRLMTLYYTPGPEPPDDFYRGFTFGASYRFRLAGPALRIEPSFPFLYMNSPITPGLVSKPITLTNSGPGNLCWQGTPATDNGNNWLSLAAGSLGPYQSARVDLQINTLLAEPAPNTGPPGRTRGVMAFSSPDIMNGPQFITLTLTDAYPRMRLDPSTVNVTASPGGPAIRIPVTLKNWGGDYFDWYAEGEAEGDVQWLALSYFGGTLYPRRTAPGLDVFIYPPAGEPRTLNGAFRFLSTRAVDSPQVLTIRLTTNPSAGSAVVESAIAESAPAGGAVVAPQATCSAPSVLELSPRSLETYTNPGGQVTRTLPIDLKRSGSTAVDVDWRAAAMTKTGENWLSVGPTGGRLASGQSSVALSVGIDSRALITGTYEGSVVVYTANASPITASVLITNIDRPLVFVHGIAGSSINYGPPNYREIWPHPAVYFAPDKKVLSLFPSDNPDGTIIPTWPISNVTYMGSEKAIVYRPLFEMLTDPARGKLRLYRVTRPETQFSTAGCDLAQAANQPNLFLFAYDWRRSNADSAEKLKGFVGCVERFYPGTRINVLTHSMGGLVARRYVLDNPSREANKVDNLFTVASPWLGGPKVVNVLEQGDFMQNSYVIEDSTMKYIAGSFDGAHELLPTKAYFDLGALPPMGEDGWDMDEDGDDGSKLYTYEQFYRAINNRYGKDKNGKKEFDPAATGKEFHGNQNGLQDDWQKDSTGINYVHVAGQRSVADTIGSVVPVSRTVCSENWFGRVTCTVSNTVRLTHVVGDMTVPLVSATRISGTTNLNAPGATVIPLTSTTASGDGLVEHTNIVGNSQLHQLIRDWLRDTNRPLGGQRAASALAAEAAASSPASAYYLDIYGGDDVAVLDAFGNSTAVISGTTMRGSVLGVSSYILGEGSEETILPGGQAYTVTFRAAAQPLSVELEYGTGQTATQVIRYRDRLLPTGVTAILTITSQGVGPLRYDGDGDGSFESVVTATVAVSGSAALDTLPPGVSVSATLEGPTVAVTLTATDEGSGVAILLYSLDRSQYQVYTSPLRLNPLATPVVYAFADDNLANRSSLVTYALARAGCCDYDGSGQVDVGDLQRVAAQWGTSSLTYDFSGDGRIGLGDLSYAARRWRQGPGAVPTTTIQPGTPTLALVALAGLKPASGTIDVAVVVTGGAGVAAFEFDLGFDSARVAVVSMTTTSAPGGTASCDPDSGRCAIVLGPVSQTGSAGVGAFSYGAGSGLTGNGVVGVIRLRSLEIEGEVGLQMSNALLVTSAGSPVTPNVQGVTLELRPVYSTFLPVVLRNSGG